MTIGEFRNALRVLLNDAIRSGLNIDDLIKAAEKELHPIYFEDDEETQGTS